MKRIGIIDYFLNNYHSRNYPGWIHEYSNGEMEVTCAYAMQESPAEGDMTNQEWSEQYGIPILSSIEEVIENSDYLMVLSPSHPEPHEELSRLALKSGKPVYIDKAFAPDLAAAKRMFALAEQYNTPCCSSSALAFVPEYEIFDKDRIVTISSKGGGGFQVYAIHQFEPVVALMNEKPVRVMATSKEAAFPSFLIQFESGRLAKTEQFMNAPFEIYAGYEDGNHAVALVESDLFKGFVLRVIEFFKTGRLVAEPWQTLSVIGLLESAAKAKDMPFVWVDIEN